MTNIILCGGSGVRLWPLSREQQPKQFCRLTGEHSLFQDTVLRNKNLCSKIIVVTNEQQYPLAQTQTKELGFTDIEFVLEPAGRNTAPAITIACMAQYHNDIVFVTPSDHHIRDERQYAAALERAETLAKNDFLVTFGIKPASPETGFGYIEADGENVVSFREKPNAETARKYTASGKHYWNSGMFVFRVKTYLEEIKHYSNDIFSASQEAFEHRECSSGIIKIKKSFMEKIPADSIDYAVMEKSSKIKMVALDISWSDLGSFEALYEVSYSDINGNVSSPKTVFAGSKNNFILAGNRPVALIDVDDLVVVDTNDALLISKRGSSQKVKELISDLEKKSPGITKNYAD